jgi:hypothetical protein
MSNTRKYDYWEEARIHAIDGDYTSFVKAYELWKLSKEYIEGNWEKTLGKNRAKFFL